MTRLVIIRHGENVWNFENRFCGWTDVDMTQKGRDQTKALANILTKRKITFDVCHTSVLKRAIESAWITLKEMNLTWIPMHKSWRLNERHYGALQGMNKAYLAKRYSKDQVDKWRWDYRETPPPLDLNDKRHPHFDRRYADLEKSDLPLAESIHDTYLRMLPYWEKNILPDLKNKKSVLLSGHKNCLRSLIKHIDKVAVKDVPRIDIPLGIIIVYEFDSKLKSISKNLLEY